MFNLDRFNAVLLQDNKTYERVLRSDLHEVVELLRRDGAGVDLPTLATEMKKVSAAKWQKYAGTRRYLEQEFAGLPNLLIPRVTGFGTTSITAGPMGAIVHVLKWESDTGNMADLANARVREHVSWPAPNGQSRNYLINEYQAPGRHFGVGNAAFTPGNLGRGDDTHAALGPFTPGIFAFAGPGSLDYHMDQVYEASYDNGLTWNAIPGSSYTIDRQVTKMGPKVRLTITKVNTTNPGDRCTNFTEV